MLHSKSFKRAAQTILALTLAYGANPICAQSPVPGRPDTYRSDSGREYNNPTAAQMDNQNAAMNQLLNGVISGMQIAGQLQQLQMQRGIYLIQNKLASTKIDARGVSPFVERSVSRNQSKIADKAAFAKEMDDTIKEFQAKMQQFGLTQNDAADVRALAFVMSYYARHNVDPGRRRLQSLREFYQKSLIKDAMFQGSPDSEKYDDFGFYAYCAMKSFNLAKGSDQEVNDNWNASKQEKINFYSGKVLNSLWSGASDDIELTPTGFASKADRLVREGGGATTFERAKNALTVGVWHEKNSFLHDREYFEKLLREFDEFVIQIGGKTNDVAWANTAAFAIYFYVASDEKERLNNAQIKSVQSLMEGDIKGSIEQQRMTDVEKLTYYENLGIRAMFTQDEFKTHKNELTGTPNSAVAVVTQQMAKKYVVEAKATADAQLRDIFKPRDWEQYRLTETGFVKK